jgi:hypothetical protein
MGLISYTLVTLPKEFDWKNPIYSRYLLVEGRRITYMVPF